MLVDVGWHLMHKCYTTNKKNLSDESCPETWSNGHPLPAQIVHRNSVGTLSMHQIPSPTRRELADCRNNPVRNEASSSPSAPIKKVSLYACG